MNRFELQLGDIHNVSLTEETRWIVQMSGVLKGERTSVTARFEPTPDYMKLFVNRFLATEFPEGLSIQSPIVDRIRQYLPDFAR